ncbi:hypothetical protein [Photobacterium nomapromontoriensis]|uniref:hypothetical protein n=1 Tax=Photobacterium nomapromontoriensis TaxID=2910237 RepID=UPI003D14F69D
MKARIDPIAIVIISLLLGWGWTELTSEPVCEEQEVRDGVTYIIPVECDTIP